MTGVVQNKPNIAGTRDHLKATGALARESAGGS